MKEECLARLILFGEGVYVACAPTIYEHYHHERNHQGKGNFLLFPSSKADERRTGRFTVKRLGELLNATGAKPHQFFDQTGV